MRLPLSLLGMASALLASCGGSGEVVATSTSDARVGLLIGDAPTDDLSSATFTLTEFRLVRETLGTTANLLAAPRTLDVLGLGRANQEALLDLPEIGSGRYVGIRIALDPNSVELRDQNGDPVAVNVLGSEAVDFFTSTRGGDLFLGSGGFASVSLDLVLDQSLRSNGAGFDFAPSIRAGHTTATPILDDWQGQVTRINRDQRWFEAELLDARDSTRFGTVRVEVADTDLLLNFSGAAFGNSNAFLASLKLDDFVEVSGAFAQDGNFDADRVEIEDRSLNQVRLEGTVVSANQGAQTFELLIEEIEKGYAVAQPVLSALGDPGVIELSWDNRTQWLGTKGQNGRGEPTDLVVGRKVDVRIDADDFVAPLPFATRSIRVDRDERYDGTVTSVADLPNTIEVTLDVNHPAVLSGEVTGPVSVPLNGNVVISLDTGVEPWLEPADLLTGMEVELQGKRTGSAMSVTVNADEVEIQPGRATGMVQSVSATEARFTMVIVEALDPFGDPEPGMTVDVFIPQEGVIQVIGEFDNMEGLRNAFVGLGAGESLEVAVEGISDGAGLVLGFEVFAETEDEED